jgi:hypothetical protein
MTFVHVEWTAQNGNGVSPLWEEKGSEGEARGTVADSGCRKRVGETKGRV